MGYQPCRRCGKMRKIGGIISADGEYVPACVHCGDSAYVEPLEDTDADAE